MRKEISTFQNLALETIKQWIKEVDAHYLAKEGIIIFWEKGSPLQDYGDWGMYKPKQVIRMIKGTRANLHIMKEINENLLILAFQEEDRVYLKGVNTHLEVPDSIFNLNTIKTKTREQTLVLWILDYCVKKKWNVENRALRSIVNHIFMKHGLKELSFKKLKPLILSVQDEAGGSMIYSQFFRKEDKATTISYFKTEEIVVYLKFDFSLKEIEGIAKAIAEKELYGDKRKKPQLLKRTPTKRNI